jgi:transposase
MLANTYKPFLGGGIMQGTAEGTMQTTIPGVIACGMDVHKDKIDVCVRIGDGSADGNVIIQTFSTMRKALYELRDWLISLNCFKVLMESTGVFWMPIYWILEEVKGLNVGVGNARDLKNAPGRPKTDREDAKWLSRLCMFGLVLKSFIVGRPFRALREYTRYHKKLVQERARQINRIEKLLQMNGFKLSSVISDITGASGLRIIKKLADKGELSVSDIRPELDRRCKSTPEEIECAINGVMKPTSRLLLKLQLKKLESCDKEIDEVYELMLSFSKEYAWAIKIIDSIPGMSILSAIYIIAEIGTDLSAFKTKNHLAAWAGLAPKDNKSADKARPSKTKKANKYVKALLIQCAWAATRTRDTRLSLWYWRNLPRLGDKKAITAVARKLICYIYAMLKSGKLYDKSLDVAYADNIGAKKLDAAQKLVGSRKKCVSPINKCENNDVDHLAGRDGSHKEPESAIGQADNSKQPENGIKSPKETATPKKRGRPKKSVTPG